MASGKVHIGLIGLGVIGQGVARLLVSGRERLRRRTGLDLVLTRAADLSPRAPEGVALPAGAVTRDARQVLRDSSIDVVVELIGGYRPALDYALEAMENGKHVVTANKELVSKAWTELHAQAARRGVSFNYSASAGGALPIVPSLRDRFVADEVTEILGILNGTTNYVLTRMAEEDEAMTDALEAARSLGFAEADPAQDIGGRDTARKLAILARTAFDVGADPDDIHTEGIGGILRCDLKAAATFGYAVKLLAVARAAEGGVQLRVHPALVSLSHPLAAVRNEGNAVYVRTREAGESMFLGRGAGQAATATAVVADIVDAVRRSASRGANADPPAGGPRPLLIGGAATRAYLRFTVADNPGNIGRITTELGKRGVGIASAHASLFRDCPGWGHVEIITHSAPDASLQAAFRDVQAMGGVGAPAGLIRIEGQAEPDPPRADTCLPDDRDRSEAPRASAGGAAPRTAAAGTLTP